MNTRGMAFEDAIAIGPIFTGESAAHLTFETYRTSQALTLFGGSKKTHKPATVVKNDARCLALLANLELFPLSHQLFNDSSRFWTSHFASGKVCVPPLSSPTMLEHGTTPCT